MKKGAVLILFIFLLSRVLAQQPGGQNNTCETAFPFCTGTLYSFPAGLNTPSAQPGPCYSCLLTTPNPAWYYMKIATPGSIKIKMHSEPSRDIDFCCWGPFPTQNSCTQLTCPKKVDCSYSTASVEYCDIPNGQTGEYYILVITNYSNQPCNIIFEQVDGTGTTDCTILPPPASNNSPICTGQTLQLSASSVNNAQYHWWGPAGFTSTQQNPSIPNATPVNSGDYFLRITVNGQPSQDTSVTHAYVYAPVADAGNDTSIANGVNTTLHGHCLGGSGSYQYHWEPVNKLVNPDIQNPQTVNLFSATLFTLTVTDDSVSCESSDVVNINITGGALTVNAVASPASICAGASTQLQAFGSGGAGNYTYQWTGPNGFSTTQQNPTVIPSGTSTYDVSINDGYNTSTNSVTVNVIALPIADAGQNDTIPFGTYIFLNGSVAGDSIHFFYSWSPADKLINANVQKPQTVNLEATTVYSLTVTDLLTNCVSNNHPSVSIVVEGGPLNVNPVATPNWICTGDTTQLHASAGGGNTMGYQYNWTSDPPGFVSTVANPYVHPTAPTKYLISVNDGFNTTSGNTNVYIYPQPVIPLKPDTTACIFELVRLDAGNPGATYMWSNGLTTQTIEAGSTGIVYDVQNYTVSVTNEHGCLTEGGITVYFSFEACTGIDESITNSRFRIHPNPTEGKITIETDGMTGVSNFAVITTFGQVVSDYTFIIGNPRNSQSIDLSNLPKGIYLLKFTNNSLIFTQKLIIK